mgnify:FL=1
MFNHNSKIINLQKVAIGNFLWMMGLVLCTQGFAQVRNSKYSGGLIGFDWWKGLQSLTSLSASEFSFFGAAILFAISSTVHLGYLLNRLFMSTDFINNSTQGGRNE